MSARDDELEPDILDALVLGLPPLGPGADLRERLLERVAGRDRFLPFVDRMAELFDLSEADAEDHLHSIDRPDDWEDMLPGVRFRDFEGGPRLGEAHGGLVRVEPGHVFPLHAHVGEERVLVLQGQVQDDEGNIYRAGDLVVSAEGTRHELRVLGDKEAIYAAAVIAIQFEDDDDE